MSAMEFQITSVSNVYLTVCSGADQRKYQSSASLAFVWGIHRSPVISPHKGPVTRNMFPFDDVIKHYLQNILRTHPVVSRDFERDNSINAHQSHFGHKLLQVQSRATPVRIQHWPATQRIEEVQHGLWSHALDVSYIEGGIE